MNLAESVNELVRSLVEMPSHFGDVIAHDPLNAIFIGLGALFVGVAVAVFGYLSLGAAVSLFTRDWSPESPPEAR